MAKRGPTAKTDEYYQEKTQAILATLQAEVPFIQLAAEANGVNRNTVFTWIRQGEEGDYRFEDFSLGVRAIRARYMMARAKELMAADRDNREGMKHQAWLLQRLDREMFDLPTEKFGKPPPPTPQEAAATAAVGEALALLSNPT